MNLIQALKDIGLFVLGWIIMWCLPMASGVLGYWLGGPLLSLVFFTAIFSLALYKTLG